MEHENCKNQEEKQCNLALNGIDHYNVDKTVTNIKTRTSSNLIDCDSLYCWYTNADCLPNKMIELKERLLASLKVPHIICITEVKPKNSRYSLNLTEVSLPNYNLYQVNVLNNIGRGILLLIHCSINSSSVEIFSDTFHESIWCRVKLLSGELLLFGTIYRSPGSSAENNNELLNVLTKVSVFKCNYLIITGDFNLPDIDWLNNSFKGNDVDSFNFKFLECLRDSFFTQHVTKPTRGRIGHNPHILDLIISKDEKSVFNINYLSPLGKSDHSVLTFDINCTFSTSTPNVTKYAFNKGNYGNMANELDLDWNNLLHGNDINNLWHIFHSHITNSMESNIPKKILSVFMRKTKHRFPLNEKILCVIRKKHRSWQRYLEDRTNERYATNLIVNFATK